MISNSYFYAYFELIEVTFDENWFRSIFYKLAVFYFLAYLPEALIR
jgi:hypothetical protein